MPNCFIPQCSASDHLFRVPKPVTDDLVRQWRVNIPRKDLQFDPNNTNHRLCYRHFDSSVVKTHDTFNIDSKLVKVERKYWTLEEGAIPTIFPGLAQYYQKKTPIKTKLFPKKDPNNISNKKARTNIATTTVAVENIARQTDSGSYLESPRTSMENWPYQELIDWKHEFTVFESSMNLLVYKLNLVDGIVRFHKLLKIDLNGSFTAQLDYVDVTSKLESPPVISFAVLEILLNNMNKLSMCKGVIGFENLKSYGGAYKVGNTFFSVKCSKINTFLVCTPCKLLWQQLRNKVYSEYPRTKPTSPRKSLKKLRETNRYQVGKNRRYCAKLLTSKQLTDLKQRVLALKRENIESALDSLGVTDNLKMTILTAINVAKAKSAQGQRYSMNWLLECLLLKIKSPAAYLHLRSANLLPLPHPVTLQRLLKGNRSEFGFNRECLDAIERQMLGKSRKDVQGFLAFDEIKLRECVEFNRCTFKFDGLIDYGEYTNELLPPTDNGKLVDHALVLMYIPYSESWVQPVASFATCGAAKSNVLSKLLMECVLKLEDRNAEVLGIVCDGATTNQNLWKDLGVSGKGETVVNKLDHPRDSSRNLFFLSDVPHLIKCVRNHFRNHVNVLFEDASVNFQFYEKLYLKDTQSHLPGLRVCPKLTKCHIWPNNFEKMVVPYATQLFSRSVADGLSHFSKSGLRQFQDCGHTERFTLAMNNLFDSLNAKTPDNGVTLDSNSFKIIKDFLETLNTKKNTFASPQTLAGLRVTLTSMIEIIEYLINGLGFQYVLTGKISQDILEKFFGLIRAAGGREEHPTVSSFTHLFRLLSIYYPVKHVLRFSGNVRSHGSVTVLHSFGETLRKRAQCEKLRKKERQDMIKETIKHKILSYDDLDNGYDLLNDSVTAEGDGEQFEHSLSDDNLIYYICGYVVTKVESLTKCRHCSSSVKSHTSPLPDVSSLLQLKDLGGLVHPSKPFYQLILNNVEPGVSAALKSEALYGDVLQDIVKKIGPLNVTGIGCDKESHGEILLSEIIPYYILLRFNFYSRSIKKCLEGRRNCKIKRKLSKLS